MKREKHQPTQEVRARVIAQLRAWASSKVPLWLVIDGGFFAIQLTGLVETRPRPENVFDLTTPSKELVVPIFPELYSTLSVVTRQSSVVVTMKMKNGLISITDSGLGAQLLTLTPSPSKRIH